MQNATETALIVGEMRGDIKSLTNTVEKIADTTEQINDKISVMSTAITDAHDRISDLIGNDNKKITHEDLREAIEAGRDYKSVKKKAIFAVFGLGIASGATGGSTLAPLLAKIQALLFSVH